MIFSQTPGQASGVKLRPNQKYKIIRGINSNVNYLCKLANVSKSGYYKWLKQADRPDKDHGDYLRIKDVFDKGKRKYGWRSIKMRLPEMNQQKNTAYYAKV